VTKGFTTNQPVSYRRDYAHIDDAGRPSVASLALPPPLLGAVARKGPI
jgi:hypothetical protein